MTGVQRLFVSGVLEVWGGSHSWVGGLLVESIRHYCNTIVTRARGLIWAILLFSRSISQRVLSEEQARSCLADLSYSSRLLMYLAIVLHPLHGFSNH